MRTYNISPSDAYEIWSRARSNKDPRICEILDALIKNSCNGEGIPVIINRNPLSYVISSKLYYYNSNNI